MTSYKASLALKKRLLMAKWHQHMTNAEKWFLEQELKYCRYYSRKADHIEYKLSDPDGAEADDVVELASNKLGSYRNKINKARAKNKQNKINALHVQVASISLVLSCIASMKMGKHHNKAAELIKEYSELLGEQK